MKMNIILLHLISSGTFEFKMDQSVLEKERAPKGNKN
jgi:hypothetical protein